MTVGVGTGVGVGEGAGVGVGEGLGVGVGVDVGVGVGVWACADDAIAKTRTKTTATALASLRARPVSVTREDRDAQHMNANPSRRASLARMPNSPSLKVDLPPVLRERQSLTAIGRGQLPGIVVLPPQVAGGDSSPHRFPKPRQKLANAQISCCNTRYNRI
jgi:hypothetical protein